jgi:hypothetical protein
MFLRKITGGKQPSAAGNHRAADQFRRVSGGREGEISFRLGMSLSMSMSMSMRAAGLAGVGAGSERLIDNALDGAGATAAFGAAAETAIKLLGVTRKNICRTHGVADVVVAEDVAGTDNH